jgi:DNA-binding NtrC family response regulator
MAKSLLLVDDDPQILDTARDILEAAGFDVQTAETGAAALTNLRGQAFALMIVDFNLADTTGVELAVQAKKIRPQMVVILMTGEGNVDLGPAKDIIHSILLKPVSPPQLIDLINKIS